LKKKEDGIFRPLFILLNELMLRIMNWLRHDFSAACRLHELNCNQCVAGAIHANGNSRKQSFQFMQARGCNSLRV